LNTGLAVLFLWQQALIIVKWQAVRFAKKQFSGFVAKKPFIPAFLNSKKSCVFQLMENISLAKTL
jgi:hypothetical protein